MEPKKIFLNGISINNFRGIKHLDANRFGSINLITGKNNSGKTTLLEAMFLCAGPGNPELLFNINARRGLDRISPKQSTIDYLYNNLDSSNNIFIIAKPKNQAQYSIKVYEKTPEESTINEITDESTTTTSSSGKLVIALEYRQSGKSKHTSEAIVRPGKLGIRNRKLIFEPSVFVSAGYRFDHDQQAERYSDLDKADQVHVYEELLSFFEEKIKRSSLVIENEQTIIHFDIGFGLIPLPALGSGFARLSAILLAISNAKNAIVLIDEVENAFHHSCLESVWKSISILANKSNCQVFAATHSDECIMAAINVFSEKPDSEFRLHRLDKGEEESQLHTFDLGELVNLSESGWDLR